jgi:hypothetical protein
MYVDTSLFYGVLTALIAIASGFAGAKAANLTRQAESSEFESDHAVRPVGSEPIRRMRHGVHAAISERTAGAQNAAAWLATSTALLGVATTRPASDAIGLAFVIIGISLVIVAIHAVWNASEVSKLPEARVAFESWYLPWFHDNISAGKRPNEEQIAHAFATVSSSYALTLRRFGIWPFRQSETRRSTPPSEWAR